MEWNDIYIKVSKLGAGGFGDVYKVREKATGKTYAMKVVNVLNADTTRFKHAKNEYNVLQTITKKCTESCPIIKEIRSFEQTNDVETYFYIIMELADGDIENFIYENDLHTLEKKTPLLKKLVNAVHFLHETADVIHGDIKPENILMIGNQPKLSDFGISCFVPNCDYSAGTPGYFDPILSKDVLNKSSDIYSLGATMYKLLTEDAYGPRYNIGEQNVYNTFIEKYADWKIKEKLGKFHELIFSMLQPFRPDLRPTIQDVKAFMDNNMNVFMFKHKINTNTKDMEQYIPSTKKKTKAQNAPKMDDLEFVRNRLKDVIKDYIELECEPRNDKSQIISQVKKECAFIKDKDKLNLIMEEFTRVYDEVKKEQEGGKRKTKKKN
jgi:serine/threonine protein kinase